jgi:N-acetylmuramoyl-L-alanine amidase
MLQIKQMPSPNFSSRNGAGISMLVLHYTGMKSAKEALDRLCNKDAKVSSHYMVDEDGSIYQLVDESNCAWHAGVSYWRGHNNVNNISIGIEIVNPGHEFGYRMFPQIQMNAVADLCKDIITRNKIAPTNVVGHSDVAPLRKEDPGELFNWHWLAGKGVGLWPVPKDIGEEGESPFRKLSDLGYETPENNIHESKIITAFQRHFRPSNIDGKWDSECEQILAGLMEMI